jgi:hypothetical protein
MLLELGQRSSTKLLEQDSLDTSGGSGEPVRCSGDSGPCRRSHGVTGENAFRDCRVEEMLFSGGGRFPSISPDGQRAVYCRDQRMVLLTLPTRTAELDLGAQVLGIGTWSPDGTMVLAGLRPRLRTSVTLSAVDWQGRRSAGIEQLPPEDHGEKSCWISRALVSGQRAGNSPGPLRARCASHLAGPNPDAPINGRSAAYFRRRACYDV